jgi:phage tail P2-like protein
MSDVLPPNATPLERELEETTERLTAVSVLVRESWNPDDCPEELLPWLAWAFSVDEWDVTWTEAEKRAVINAAYDVQRRKGSVESIKSILDSFGFSDGVLQEGAAAGGTWAQYKVAVPRLLEADEADAAIRALNATAPARCELLTFDFRAAALKYDGSAIYDGTYTHGEISG